jgi:3',5'-nucleoside bisphosphate phosphatase
MFCDLHMHSTASDGTKPPDELPALVQAAGVEAFALTDHDTTDGLDACGRAAAALGLDFLPGIEISADPTDVLPAPRAGLDDGPDLAPPRYRKGTLHLLGYGISPACAPLQQTLQELRQARAHRNPQIVHNLKDLGVSIDMDEVTAMARRLGDGRVVGRPHIAQVLVSKGYAKSVQDAFNRYIGEGRPAYARKDFLPPAGAIGAIHAAGGLAVLAHPVQLACAGDADLLEYFIKRLCELGLDGLEVYHSDHTPAAAAHFAQLAQRYHLVPTGGSDFHGGHKAIGLGSQKVPLAVFTRLRAALNARAAR